MVLLSEFSHIFGNPGGRSGSFFIFSSDKKYIIKTISNKELKVLLSSFLIAYHTHLYKFQESVISRILGVYTFTVNRNSAVNFILIQSVYTSEFTKNVYDLKGSKLDRQTIMSEDEGEEEKENRGVLKDIDFLRKQKTIEMPVTVGQRLIEILENDVRLFQKFNLMDYSLLLAVKKREEYSKYFFKGSNSSEKGYSLGIIDFLQKYNNTKKIEGISKKLISMKPRNYISSINPEDYRQRFLNFVKEIIA